MYNYLRLNDSTILLEEPNSTDLLRLKKEYREAIRRAIFPLALGIFGASFLGLSLIHVTTGHFSTNIKLLCSLIYLSALVLGLRCWFEFARDEYNNAPHHCMTQILSMYNGIEPDTKVYVSPDGSVLIKNLSLWAGHLHGDDFKDIYEAAIDHRPSDVKKYLRAAKRRKDTL